MVLSGHEASSHCCPFPRNLVWKTLRAGTYGRLSPVPGQAERGWALRHSVAQLAASPSVQGPDACVPGTHLGEAPNLGQVLRARRCPWDKPGERASNAPIWPLRHTSIGPYI